MFQHPSLVARIVGGDPQLGAVDEGAGEMRNGIGGDDATLAVARLGPRIGKEHEGTPHGSLAERREQEPGVVAEHAHIRSEEHTSELQSLIRTSYAVFCLKTKKSI